MTRGQFGFLMLVTCGIVHLGIIVVTGMVGRAYGVSEGWAAALVGPATALSILHVGGWYVAYRFARDRRLLRCPSR